MTYFPTMPDATLEKAFSKWPNETGPMVSWFEAIMRGPSSLSDSDREVLGTFVSRINGCDYCVSVHERVAERLGASPEAAKISPNDLDDAPVDDKMKAILRFARQLCQTPIASEQSDVQAVLDAGWDEDAVFHATSVCAAFNAINRIVDGLGFTIDDESADGAAEMLAEHGYQEPVGKKS